MSRQNVSIEQNNLREATERYFNSLPPTHRELLYLMAADYQKPAYAIIAGAIEAAIATWKNDYLSMEGPRRARRERRSA